MSMTESEVIDKLRQEAKNNRADADWKWRHGQINADGLIQSAENMEQIAKWIEELQQYRAIGTVSEFQQLKEKAMAKKPIYSDFDENEDEEIIPYKAVCPVCGYEFEFGTWNDEENHHCECGQRMFWD